MLWRHSHIKCFDDELEREGAFDMAYAGMKTIRVEQIVGSVDRCDELRDDFLPHTEEGQARFDRIWRAMQEGVEMPVIEVYQIRDQYYLVDGHHRVAVAKRMGQLYIDAEVTEYIPTNAELRNALYRERREFEHRTGLQGIMLTELGQYDKLLNQIEEHRYYMAERRHAPVGLREAAEVWRDEVFRPVVAEIEQRGFGRKLRGRTSADFYVYVCDHKWLRSRALGADLSFAWALDEFERLLNRGRDRGWLLRTIQGLAKGALEVVEEAV